MVRAGVCVAASVLAVAAWGAVGAAQPPKGDKAVDLSALREAVAAAARKGENVDEVAKALDALEKTAPKAGAGRVPPELQALRDAVDGAAKKGENVEAITKELVAVETAIAGRALTKPKPEPQPNPPGNLNPNGRGPRQIVAPEAPFIAPDIRIGDLGGGGIDVEAFNKAMELRRKAMELLLKDPNDPAALKEAQRLQAEAAELMLKMARGGGGLVVPAFPGADFARVPDRARLGIRLERVPPVATEQLGLEPNTGVVVTMVVAGSPAEKAGLKVHDIILEFAGKVVTDNTEDFVARVNDAKAGAKIDLVVLRKGKKVEVKGVELQDARGARALPNAANPPKVLEAALEEERPLTPPKPPVPAPPAPPKP